MDGIARDPLAALSVAAGFAASEAAGELVLLVALVPLVVHLAALALGVWGVASTRIQ